MGAEADAICGAPYGMVGEQLVNRRNGYRRGAEIPGWAPWSWWCRSCVPAVISGLVVDSSAAGRVVV